MAGMVETARRSVVKSISWRIFAALITSSLAYILTGKGEFAARSGSSTPRSS